MPKTVNLSRESLLHSFLQGAKALSSSGLAICGEGHLYYSGLMIAAWQGDNLFVDCGTGTKSVTVKNQIHFLRSLAEKECIAPILYNEFSLPISPDFRFVREITSYSIGASPERVNPINIAKQVQKVLDLSARKNISCASIQYLISSLQRINDLFGFTCSFDVQKHQQKIDETKKVQAIERESQAAYHLQQYRRLTAS
jgi:hypothetical protein